MSQGYLYFAVNAAMPGFTKIGVTQLCPTARLTELQSTGVPSAFTLTSCFFVCDIVQCEREVHDILKEFRPAKNREFFNIAPRDAITLALPRLTPFIADQGGNGEANPFPDLPNDEEGMILAFLRKPRNVFWTTEDFIAYARVDPIDGRYWLGELKRKGYFASERMARSGTHTWELGHKGLAYARWLRSP